MTMKKQAFSPLQPEIQYVMDNYMEQKPFKQLASKNIALYYQFNTPNTLENSVSLVPDGCFDIVFCCCPIASSTSIWTSPTQRSKQLHLQANCEYFGIRFLPEQNLIKLKKPMKELLGNVIPIDDFMTLDPSIINKIISANNFTDRINIFNNHIQTPNIKSKSKLIIDYCINKIYLFKGKININHLSIDTGYSDRYIRNIFEEKIGFSPKQFSEIVRFQNSLAMILKENHYSMLDVVHENGYHDQAHFIKGFKKFVHIPPNRYRKSLLIKK